MNNNDKNQPFCSRYKFTSLIWFIVLPCCLIPQGVKAANNLETVTLQLKWQHQFQFAGYYAALEKGFYRDVGLDVKIKALGPGHKPVIEQVVSGTAHYGIMDSGLVKHRLDGKPVVALAAVFQKSPLVWLVRKDSGIRSPHDLVGKRVMYLPGLQNSDLLAMLQVEGIPANKIEFIANSFDINDLINRHVDAFSAYITNQPQVLHELGIPYRIINPQDYGINFYGDVLFTSQIEVDTHPKRVQAFRHASLNGWKYAMDHPDEIIHLIKTKYASDKSLSQLRYEAESMRELIMPEIVPIGHINPGRWQFIAERLASLGLSNSNYHLLQGFNFDPSPKPYNPTQLYIIIITVTLFALLFLSLTIWISRLNIRLKKSEQRLREAQHIAKMGNWSLTVSTGELYWSDEIYRIFGRQPGDFTPSREHFYETVHPDDVTQVKRSEYEAFSKNRKLSIDHRILLPDGSVRWVHEDAIAIMDKDGNPVSLAGTVQDITEHKLTLDRKQQLQQQLQQAQKMEAIGNLTGGIAHDFNNILASILGFTELAKELTEDDQNERLTYYLNEVEESGLRGAELIKQMLIFSRGDTDNRENQFIDISSLLERSIKMLRPVLPSNIDIKLDIPKFIPWLMGNPINLQQVIMNLCINARDAIKGHGKISISLKELKTFQGTCHACHRRIQGDFVEFSITDSGSGIDNQIRQHLFEPFYTTKDVGKGSGMGLAMVHGIMHEHGGHIIVHSNKPQGTTFQLFFPIPGQTSKSSINHNQSNGKTLFAE